MSCANCGRTYEEHVDGSAYRDFTGAGTECGGYVDVDIGKQPNKTVICDANYNVVAVINPAQPGTRRVCGAPTKFYERPDFCLKCEKRQGEK